MNSTMRASLEKQPTKKKPNISSSSIFYFFTSREPFKNDDLKQQKFLENLVLLIVKIHLHLQFVKSVWPKGLILHFCILVQFLSWIIFSHDVLHGLVKKTKYLINMFWFFLKSFILPLLVLILKVQRCSWCVCLSHNFLGI